MPIRPTPVVSAVIPALDDQALLERHLPPLLTELETWESQVVLVDDTGKGRLDAWARSRFPEDHGGRLVVHARRENSGYAAALLDGARVARGELLLCLNPDVCIRPGFLAPLVEVMEDPSVFAASPRVLLQGEEDQAESHNVIQQHDGRLRVKPIPPVQRRFTNSIPFAVGGAMILSRAEFLGGGGFDPLFEPFYWEDVDLGLCAWRRGQRVVEVAESVVEHHHRGTIGAHVPEELILAAIEKNRHQILWKHIDAEQEGCQLVGSLMRDAIDAAAGDRREELIWLGLALQELAAVEHSRQTLGPSVVSLRSCLARSAPK